MDGVPVGDRTQGVSMDVLAVPACCTRRRTAGHPCPGWIRLTAENGHGRYPLPAATIDSPVGFCKLIFGWLFDGRRRAPMGSGRAGHARASWMKLRVSSSR